VAHKLHRLTIEILGTDEELATERLQESLPVIAQLLDVVEDSLVIEPHDETRGIWSSIQVYTDLDRYEGIIAYIKGLIHYKLNVTGSSKLRIGIRQIQTGDNT
jgi:hypothetical protein